MAKRKRQKNPAVPKREVRPNDDTPDLILQLPPELRNRIYELLFSAPDHRIFLSMYSMPWKEPPLLQTCKQIRHEALPVYYGNNKFELYTSLNGKELKTCINRLYSIVQICGPKPFANFQIRIKGSVWNNLSEGGLLQLLELMRATGFDPVSQRYQPPSQAIGFRPTVHSSVFRMAGSNYGNAQFVLEKALSLGRRARAEGWTQERLAKRFGGLAKDQYKKKGREAKIFVEMKAL